MRFPIVGIYIYVAQTFIKFKCQLKLKVHEINIHFRLNGDLDLKVNMSRSIYSVVTGYWLDKYLVQLLSVLQIMDDTRRYTISQKTQYMCNFPVFTQSRTCLRMYKIVIYNFVLSNQTTSCKY
jgi:hypothetical protein